MKKALTILVLFLMVVSSSSARIWKSAKGKELEADFVSASETLVTLRRKSDGKSFTLPITRLSKEDQEFIRNGAQSTSEKSVEPAALEGEYAHLVTGDWVLAEHGKLPYAFYGRPSLDLSQQYPLVVSLHGKSGNNENGKQIGFVRRFARDDRYTEHPCLILSPLCYQPYGGTGGGWDDAPGEETLDLIKDLVKKLPLIDPNRIYVVGVSMGGFGTWHFLKEEPRLFAAGIPICGYGHDVGKLRSMPIWSFHGEKDEIVSVEGARRCAEELKRSKVFKYTEFAGAGHGITGQALDDADVNEWLFAQKRK